MQESRRDLGTRYGRSSASTLIVASMLMVSACTGSDATADNVPPGAGGIVAVTAAEFEETTEERVLEQGFDVAIDCGSDDVPLIAGTSLDCVAVYRGDDSVSRLTVTIETVTGTDYDLSVIGLGEPVGVYDP